MNPEPAQTSANAVTRSRNPRTLHPSLLPARRGRGFTLVELVVILLLIGILSVAAYARLDSSKVFAERTEYDMVRSTLQYARKSAIAKRRYVCVQVASSGLTLSADGNPPESTAANLTDPCSFPAAPFTAALPLPQPDSRCAAANLLCLSNTSLASSASSFTFDPQGRAVAVSIVVSGYPAITVEAETGLVY
jgi:MSHA pilin protein MshC